MPIFFFSGNYKATTWPGYTSDKLRRDFLQLFLPSKHCKTRERDILRRRQISVLFQGISCDHLKLVYWGLLGFVLFQLQCFGALHQMCYKHCDCWHIRARLWEPHWVVRASRHHNLRKKCKSQVQLHKENHCPILQAKNCNCICYSGWLRNRTGTGNRNRRNRFSWNRKRNRNRRNRFPGTETGTVLSCFKTLLKHRKKPLLQRNRQNRKPELLEPFHPQTVTEPNQTGACICYFNANLTLYRQVKIATVGVSFWPHSTWSP